MHHIIWITLYYFVYLKRIWTWQSQNHYARFRIVHPEGKANFMVFLKNVFEFDFKVGPHLATHFYNGPSKLGKKQFFYIQEIVWLIQYDS